MDLVIATIVRHRHARRTLQVENGNPPTTQRSFPLLLLRLAQRQFSDKDSLPPRTRW